MSEVALQSPTTAPALTRSLRGLPAKGEDVRFPASGSLASAANVLRVLRMFESQSTLAVSEVGRLLGVGKSTAHRLLCTLVAEGFVTRDPVHRQYYAGPVLMDIGLAAAGQLDVRQRAQVPLNRLAAQTGTTAMLHALQGEHARCLHVAEAPTPSRVTGRVGDLVPANASPAGKLLLCGEDEERLRRRFPHGLARVTEHTITDWDTFLVELQTTREQGWAVSYEEGELGVHSLALGVRGLTQPTLVALTVSAPAARIARGRQNQRELLHHMRTALGAMYGAPSRIDGDAPGGRSDTRTSTPIRRLAHDTQR